MPKETVRRLSEDTQRLLVAGAHLAPGDPDFARDLASLEALAAQVGARAPVLGKLSEAARRAVSGKDPADLVSLAANLAQVRAAHAEVAPAGDAVAPLPPALGLGTPCGPQDLYDLHAALTVSGSGRDEKIRTALARGNVADLRLADAVLQALADPYLGDRIEEQLLPKFGTALLGSLRKDFNPKGATADARRLRAIVSLAPERAGETLRAALTEGSAPVRQAAFRLLADRFPGQADFEPLVLEAVRKERALDVRAAAVRAAGGYSGDAALEALLGTLDRADLSDDTVEALRRSRHPQLVPRLLKLLDGEFEAAERRRGAKEKVADRARAIFSVLSAFKEPEIIRRGLETLNVFGTSAAEAVLHSDDPAQLARIADLLLGDRTELFGPAMKAAEKLGPEEAFKRFSAVFRNRAKGAHRLELVVEHVASSPDRRWDEFLLDVMNTDLGLTAGTKLRKLLGKKPKPELETAWAITAIGRRGNKAAVQPLLKALASDPPAEIERVLFEAVGELKDPSVVPALLEMGREGDDPKVTRLIARAVHEVAAPETVPLVRKFLSKYKEGSKAQAAFAPLLLALQDRFPGN